MAVYPAATMIGGIRTTKSTKKATVNMHHKKATTGLYSCSRPFTL